MRFWDISFFFWGGDIEGKNKHVRAPLYKKKLGPEPDTVFPGRAGPGRQKPDLGSIWFRGAYSTCVYVWGLAATTYPAGQPESLVQVRSVVFPVGNPSFLVLKTSNFKLIFVIPVQFAAFSSHRRFIDTTFSSRIILRCIRTHVCLISKDMVHAPQGFKRKPKNCVGIKGDEKFVFFTNVYYTCEVNDLWHAWLPDSGQWQPMLLMQQ